MKIYKILFVTLLFIQTAIYALPLTIINITLYPMAIDVNLESGTQQIFLAPQAKWTTPLDNDAFKGMSWNGYTQNYNINIEQDAPRMLNGGAFLIGKNGWCMYDDKQGRGVKFIQGQ